MEESTGLNRLNTGTLLGATVAVSIVTIFLAMIASPLVDDAANAVGGSELRVPVWERAGLPYDVTSDYGSVLETGPYTPLATQNEWNSTHVFVEYELPLSEGGASATGLQTRNL